MCVRLCVTEKLEKPLVVWVGHTSEHCNYSRSFEVVECLVGIISRLGRTHTLFTFPLKQSFMPSHQQILLSIMILTWYEVEESKM